MAEKNNSKVWSTPKLIVIARNRSEERVLYTCKAYGDGADNSSNRCLSGGGVTNTGYCDVIKPS